MTSGPIFNGTPTSRRAVERASYPLSTSDMASQGSAIAGLRGNPMTQPLAPPDSAGLPVRSEVRLRMKAAPAAHGLDGAWWPRSRDAEAEFPDLVLAASSWVGPVRRVTYHLDDWDAAARELVVDGWRVELLGDTTLEPNTVLVMGNHQRQRTLLVIPPDLPGGTARAVLRSSAGPEVVSARELLASNGVRPRSH